MNARIEALVQENQKSAARCAAKLVCNRSGAPCPYMPIDTIEGFALCWTHSRTVRDGRAPLHEVLEGTRPRSPHDYVER